MSQVQFAGVSRKLEAHWQLGANATATRRFLTAIALYYAGAHVWYVGKYKIILLVGSETQAPVTQSNKRPPSQPAPASGGSFGYYWGLPGKGGLQAS